MNGQVSCKSFRICLKPLSAVFAHDAVRVSQAYRQETATLSTLAAACFYDRW